ncbi:transposase [Rhizobium ruizarguesonis]
MSGLLEFPDDLYELGPDEPALFGHNADAKRYVEHLKSVMGDKEWRVRRDAAAKRFYRSLVGEQADPTGKGKFYDSSDVFAWYLFQGEAFNDHPQNYEVVSGCRVIPVLAALGRNLEKLQQVGGYAERLQRLIFKERAQPNAGLFEFLVAAAYVQAGYMVNFHPEKPGRGKSHDIDVARGSESYAIECKRMESGQYHENERARMRTLWRPTSRALVQTGGSFCFDLTFKTEIDSVPQDYFPRIAKRFIAADAENEIIHDEFSFGSLRRLDLKPLQAALSESYWMHPGPKYNNLLLGSYRRYENLLLAHKVRFAPNPHFIDEIDQAVALRWRSASDTAVDKQARDVIGKLVEANKQLPTDRVGIVHIGFEALGGDAVEQRRYEKIKASISGFDTMDKPLAFVFCHYLSPEASLDEAWAIDETTHYHKKLPGPLPLEHLSLLTPLSVPFDTGVHWSSKAT